MGNSFKLQKSSGSNKQEALSGGILLIILGIVTFFLFSAIAGIIFGVVGLVLALGGVGASE